MVAKITSSSSLFGVLSYNQEKVNEGVANVLYSQNIIRTVDGSYNIPTCMRSFEPYLAANKRTESPVIHISLNPHPDDVLTDSQLTDIAQEYMRKMGYGNQPYLVYRHEDIDRAHIHIVSLRVDETGKKINDSFERKRSKQITRELEKKYNLIPADKKDYAEDFTLKRVDSNAGNIKKQIAGTVKAIMETYRFQSIGEYRALLSLYGLTIEEVKGEMRGKPYNGLVFSIIDDKGEKNGNPFKASLIGRMVGYDATHKHFLQSKEAFKDKKLKEPIKKRVKTAIQKSVNREQFEKELAKQGIHVVFRETTLNGAGSLQNEDKRIYGVTFIDHNEKVVLNGSRLGKEFSANVFHDWFNSGLNPETKSAIKPEHEKDFHPKHDVEKSIEPFSDYSEEQSSSVETVAGLFSLEQHGDDYAEIAFTNRMRRKKKKRKGRQL